MYENEEKILQEAKALIENMAGDGSISTEAYKSLLSEYESLLGEIKFITRISDRLQNKLNGINQNLLKKTAELEQAQTLIMKQNNELQQAKEGLEQKVQERTKALSKANEDLQASVTELDNFVYRASHDIKGPLASIMGVCNIAMLDAEGESQQYFKMMLGVATQLQNKLNRLLGLNNLKHSPIALETLSLSELVEDCIDEIKTLHQNKSIEFVVKTQNKALITTDRLIFRNMLSNLLEYAANNARDREVSIQKINLKVIRETGIQILLSFKGDAISAEVAQQIFKMFYRTSNNKELTGMELYTVSLLAEKLNGRVELLSSNDKETIFSIFLPQSEDALPKP